MISQNTISISSPYMMQICSPNPNFDNVFNLELCSILSQYLEPHEIFNIISALNTNFNQIVRRLKKFNKIWIHKYLKEFSSQEEYAEMKGQTANDGDEMEQQMEMLNGFL